MRDHREYIMISDGGGCVIGDLEPDQLFAFLPHCKRENRRQAATTIRNKETPPVLFCRFSGWQFSQKKAGGMRPDVAIRLGLCTQCLIELIKEDVKFRQSQAILAAAEQRRRIWWQHVCELIGEPPRWKAECHLLVYFVKQDIRTTGVCEMKNVTLENFVYRTF